MGLESDNSEIDKLDGYLKLDNYNLDKIERIASHYQAILADLGEDPTREGLLQTPVRVAQALRPPRPLTPAICAASLLGHHHVDELVIVDLPVTVDVCLADHLVDLLVRQLLAEVRHDVAQLGRGDEAVTVLVEDLEGLLDLLSTVRVLHLSCHHREELGEVNRAVSVCVNLVDHVLELCLRGVLAK